MSSAVDPSRAAPDVGTAVLLLSFASFFSSAGLRISDGLIPRIAADFSLSTGTAGQVVLTFALAYGVSQLVFGPLGDHYGKPRLIRLSLAGCALASLACAFAPGFDALLALRVLWGLAAAGIVPLAMAWIGDTVPYERRQATLARLSLGTMSGMLAGQLAGGLFADSAPGWRGAFLSLCVGYGAIAVLLASRSGTMPAGTPPASGGAPATGLALSPRRQLGSVLREPWARRVLLTVGGEGVLLLGPMAFLPAYVHARFQVPVSVASALVAFFAVGGIAYAVFARRIVREVGEVRMLGVGGALVGAGFVGLYLAPQAWLVAPVVLLLGFGTSLFHSTLQTHATQMAPAARGSSLALFSFSLFFGQALGVSWAGQALDRLGPALMLLLPAATLPWLAWSMSRALRQRGA
ncbi:MFS transporter [Ramlibacter sp. AW1]|uniref:MFS transporter n=1 Tax=Ramlibacter aurantiacus TaxID=2801330 RepID=A0A937D1U9_9BURK|nr:MFS transporter [Ramlibacter aurantiacus]MBL0419135.1 MFS transporter [Ramlibacter aurantiacus]